MRKLFVLFLAALIASIAILQALSVPSVLSVTSPPLATPCAVSLQAQQFIGLSGETRLYKPLPGARVTISEKSGRTLHRGITDAAGAFVSMVETSAIVVQVDYAGHPSRSVDYTAWPVPPCGIGSLFYFGSAQ